MSIKKTVGAGLRACPTDKQPMNKMFYHDLKGIVEQSKQEIAVGVNATMSMMYWQIGKEYGNSFSLKNLRRMIQFSEVFPDKQIVVSLIRQLSWTHISIERAKNRLAQKEVETP